MSNKSSKSTKSAPPSAAAPVAPTLARKWYKVTPMNLNLNFVEVITSARLAQVIVDWVMETAAVISIDCERDDKGKNVVGIPTIVQMGIPVRGRKHPQIYIFDVLQNTALPAILKPIMESRQILKVIHDARQDIRALWLYYGIHLRNVFDTQLADLALQYQDGIRQPRRIALNKLVLTYGGPSINEAKQNLKEYYKTKTGYWRRRPLTKEQIFNSAHDVFALIPNVFENLIQSLDETHWRYFQQQVGIMIRECEALKRL